MDTCCKFVAKPYVRGCSSFSLRDWNRCQGWTRNKTWKHWTKFKRSTYYNHQNYYYGYCSSRNLFEISFFISLLNHFVYWHSVIMTSAQNWLKTTISSCHVPFNPLSPNFIQIEILQTDLHTFPSRIGSENLFVDQSTAHQVIILFILTAVSLDYVLTLLRENWLWSLLGLEE